MQLLNRDQPKVKLIIAVLGVTLTGLLISCALSLVPPRYEASASILLLPGEASIPDSANPFLYLGNLSQARDVLIKIVNSDTTRAELVGSDNTDYEVLGDFSTGAPLVLVTATGPRPESALALKDSVLEMLSRELERLQDLADTPSGAKSKTMVLTSDERPLLVTKSQTRAAVLAGAAGVGMTFAALAAAEALSRRRTRRDDPSWADPTSAGAALETLEQVGERRRLSGNPVSSAASPTRY